MEPHFKPGQVVTAQASGKLYKIERVRTDAHPKLKGAVGYSVVGQRDGKDFGPVRLMPESSFAVPSCPLCAARLKSENPR